MSRHDPSLDMLAVLVSQRSCLLVSLERMGCLEIRRGRKGGLFGGLLGSWIRKCLFATEEINGV